MVRWRLNISDVQMQRRDRSILIISSKPFDFLEDETKMLNLKTTEILKILLGLEHFILYSQHFSQFLHFKLISMLPVGWWVFLWIFVCHFSQPNPMDWIGLDQKWMWSIKTISSHQNRRIEFSGEGKKLHIFNFQRHRWFRLEIHQCDYFVGFQDFLDCCFDQSSMVMFIYWYKYSFFFCCKTIQP